MRCPECNMFVSMETEIESSDFEMDDDGHITGNVRVVRNCAECSTELKAADFDVDEQVDIGDHTGEGHVLELNVEEPDVEEDVQRTDRHGKPIRNPRYMRTLIGYRTSYTVSCTCTDAEAIATGDLVDTMPASAFDESV